jgi:lysophospholipase L1-like esterase
VSASESTPTNHRAIERREFLKRGAAAALGAGCFGLGGAADLLAAPRARRAAGSAPRAANEMFRIAVLGDSAAWGQGLAFENKTSGLVVSRLKPQLGGRDVGTHTAAHSGAVITPSKMNDDAAWAAKEWDGEIPRPYPSITYQAAERIRNPEQCQLVIMNGGINDVGAMTIVSPSASVTPELVRTLTRTACHDNLALLLKNVVVPRFRNATIVVTNYFPIVGPDSDIAVLKALLTILMGPLNAPAMEEALRAKLAAQSQAFHEESTRGMREAVAAANAGLPAPRVLFVDGGFTAAHAIGMPGALLYNPFETDQAYMIREAQCGPSFGILDPANIAVCHHANMGHPNPRGADVFAQAIMRAIAPMIPAWAAQAPVATTPAKALSVAVTAGATSVTGKTVTVVAKDAATGQGLAGTVRINGVTGATGQPITFPRCFTTETFTGALGKPMTRRIYGACEGTVAVAGYPDETFAA